MQLAGREVQDISPPKTTVQGILGPSSIVKGRYTVQSRLNYFELNRSYINKLGKCILGWQVDFKETRARALTRVFCIPGRPILSSRPYQALIGCLIVLAHHGDTSYQRTLVYHTEQKSVLPLEIPTSLTKESEHNQIQDIMVPALNKWPGFQRFL